MAITFYNPKKSAMKIALAIEKKWGIIEIAGLLPGVSPKYGASSKGSKTFDWQNRVMFAIGPEEAPVLLKFIKSTNRTKDTITLTHSPSGNTKEQLSSLTLSGKYPYINVTISKTKNNQKLKQTFTLRSSEKSDEISVFFKFLEKIVESVFYEDYFYTLVKYSIENREKINNTINKQKYPKGGEYYNAQ